MQVKVLAIICFTFAMDTSATAAAAADDDEDSDFLSRILGIFLGDSDAAAGTEPVDVVGSGAGGPLWDWSGSIFWRFKGETAKLNFVQYWKGAMARRIIPIRAVLRWWLPTLMTPMKVQKLTWRRESSVVLFMGCKFPLQVNYSLISDGL